MVVDAQSTRVCWLRVGHSSHCFLTTMSYKTNGCTCGLYTMVRIPGGT